MKKKLVLLVFIVFQCTLLKSQIPTEQDCLGAIPLCGPLYTTSDAPLGQGNFQNEVGPGSCQTSGEINSIWLKFSIQTSGDLAFTLYPVSNMDFDWALYNLTNDSCENIQTNGSLLSSCNSSQYSITGISSSGVGNWNGFGFTNAFNYLLPVFSGERYYLQINNFYGASGGFTIDFTASTAILSNCDSAYFGAAETGLCEKFCTDFIDSSTSNATSWHWIFPGGNPSTSSDQNPANICYNNPGTYDVTLITFFPGGSDTLVLPDYITVFPTPQIPAITQTGYTLTSTPASSYQWQFNSVEIPGATSQTYDVIQSGYYSVFITDQNGCTSSSTTLNVMITDVNNVAVNPLVIIFPNPSSGNFMIEWLNCEGYQPITIQIVNCLGEIIFSEEAIPGKDLKKSIELKNPWSGTYFLELTSAQLHLVRKITIEN